MKQLMFAVVALGMLVLPQPAWSAPPQKGVHKKKLKRAASRTRVKHRAGKNTPKARIKSPTKKKRPVFQMPDMSVKARAPAPEAVYVLTRARVKYTRPNHEDELLGWILHSMRNR